MKHISCNICGSQKNTTVFLLRDLYTNINDPTKFRLARCSSCGFSYLDPQPNYEELSPFYQHGYFVEPKNYAAKKGFYSFLRKIRRKFLPKFSPRFYKWNLGDRTLPANFLDVGCATGAKDQRFINDFPRWNFFGVEPDAQAAKSAASVKGLTVSRGFLKDARFSGGFFDIVLFHHVLEHTLDPLADIKESYRILKTNGKLIITVPNYGSFTAKIFGKYWRHLDIPRHLFHFRARDLKKMLNNAGFDVEKIQTETIQGSVFSSFLLSVGIHKNFENALPVVLLRFIFVPVNKVAELFGWGGALYVLAVKK